MSFDTAVTVALREGTELVIAFENFGPFAHLVAAALAGRRDNFTLAEVAADVAEELLDEAAVQGVKIGIAADLPDTIKHTIHRVDFANKQVHLERPDGEGIVSFGLDAYATRFRK